MTAVESWVAEQLASEDEDSGELVRFTVRLSGADMVKLGDLARRIGKSRMATASGLLVEAVDDALRFLDRGEPGS